MKTAVEYIEEQLEASYKDAFNDLFEVILVAKTNGEKNKWKVLLKMVMQGVVIKR